MSRISVTYYGVTAAANGLLSLHCLQAHTSTTHTVLIVIMIDESTRYLHHGNSHVGLIKASITALESRMLDFISVVEGGKSHCGTCMYSYLRITINDLSKVIPLKHVSPSFETHVGTKLQCNRRQFIFRNLG
ncbi:hypothetical protein M378DRAFT_460573 [Amanita muscaria Koide BX008]|uniref:Uncharacterized protein n=1 Tax=Amanita muscaria (strain Koide BX008) TaxID=946122 RepID=A0A0C2XAD2_AMAMK|nr:hypothetical protein M378DRAFT_460573 [Amanita muscaria Koide BX008]